MLEVFVDWELNPVAQNPKARCRHAFEERARTFPFVDGRDGTAKCYTSIELTMMQFDWYLN